MDASLVDLWEIIYVLLCISTYKSIYTIWSISISVFVPFKTVVTFFSLRYVITTIACTAQFCSGESVSVEVTTLFCGIIIIFAAILITVKDHGFIVTVIAF